MCLKVNQMQKQINSKVNLNNKGVHRKNIRKAKTKNK